MGLFLPLGAAILWGLQYALLEKVLKYIPITYYLLIQIFVFFIVMSLIFFLSGNKISDFTSIFEDKNMFLLSILTCIIAITANILIFYAIKQTNATLSGIIEITYPLFIIIFTYFIFKKSHLTYGVVLGGIFIFVGLIIIIYSNNS